MQRDNHVHVAFVGNPNCGKTTLFNAITGSKLKVANWPGVTVEKYEGTLEYEDVYKRQKYPIDYNIEAVKTLIRRAMDKGFYEGCLLYTSRCV